MVVSRYNGATLLAEGGSRVPSEESNACCMRPGIGELRRTSLLLGMSSVPPDAEVQRNSDKLTVSSYAQRTYSTGQDESEAMAAPEIVWPTGNAVTKGRTNGWRRARAAVVGLLALCVGSVVWAFGATVFADVPGPLGAAPALGLIDIEEAFPNLTFDRMVHLADSGDGTGRLWVVLQAGTIEAFDNDRNASTSAVFLDIRNQVSDEGFEEGLLGLAFDPGYASNGYFYVYYSAANPRRSVVSRYSVGADPDQADVSSELVIIEVDQPFPNHNGGTLAFGPDGYLYVSLGDGGDGGDPLGHGQDRTTLLGSILRIDVSASTLQEPYRVPPDNPFVGATDGTREEIWAYGLRNPWKLSFDSVTGDLWVGDVGQASYEEVDLVTGGGNYGWNVMEGFSCYPPGNQSCDQTGLEQPVFDYTHGEGCSVTGDYVYRGDRIGGLVGAYVYGDYCSGRVWGLRYEGSSVTEQALLADTGLLIPSFGTDGQGNLYILSFDGKIYRFVAPAQMAAPLPELSVWGLIAFASLIGASFVWRTNREMRTRASG